MTLKERFKNILFVHKLSVKDQIDRCQIIAEDFAIAYSVWFCEQIKDDKMDNYSLEELIEIYKKEKEL